MGLQRNILSNLPDWILRCPDSQRWHLRSAYSEIERLEQLSGESADRSVLLNPISNLTITVMIPETLKRWTAALEPMKIFRMSVTICISIISKSCWTEFSTTLDAVSGHFRTFRKRSGILLIKTGSTSILTVTVVIRTDSGMRDGKDISNWSN